MRLDEIRKYSERALPGEFINDDEQASDQNKQDNEINATPPNLAEGQIKPNVTEEPELAIMPEQKKQEPTMKALKKKVKKMKKKRTKQQLEAEELYPETDEEENQTKWAKEGKVKEEREEPSATDSSTNTEPSRRGGRNRQRLNFYGQNVMVTRINKTIEEECDSER